MTKDQWFEGNFFGSMYAGASMLNEPVVLYNQ